MMRNLIAAIDLGTTKVVCTVGEKTSDGVKIIGYCEVPSKGIKRGRVENIKFAHQSLSQAVAAVEKQIGMKISAAVVGIAGQDIKCRKPAPTQVIRNNPDDMITQQEVTKISNDMYGTPLEDGYRVIFAVPQCYNVDNYMSVSEPVGMVGRNIVAAYKLFIGKDNSGRLIQATLNMAGIRQIEQVLEPIASAYAVLSGEEMELGCAMVDIGGGTTDVVVIQNNTIRHVGIIPFGGNSVTEDICTGCNITQRQAEQIKKEYGCCLADYADSQQVISIHGVGGDKMIQAKSLAKIIQARMEEILEGVYWHICRSDFKDFLRGGIVFTGGGSLIGNLTNLATVVTGYGARIAHPTDYTIAHDSVAEARTATASTAVGSIIYGFRRIEDGIEYGESVSEKAKPVTPEPAPKREAKKTEPKKEEPKPDSEKKPKKTFMSRLFESFSSDDDEA